ncbi:hypothetical protein SLE2022_372070 [Rubroshorea leprosula]
MNSRCAACKYLRRRCPSDCIFSPYFPPNDPQRFACIHRIYGASNVARMLQQLPENQRASAVDCLYYEAQCRVQDPVYGCVGLVSLLYQQIHDAETEIAKTQAQIALIIDSNTQEQQVYLHQDVEVESDLNILLHEQGDEFSLLGPPNQASSGFI